MLSRAREQDKFDQTPKTLASLGSHVRDVTPCLPIPVLARHAHLSEGQRERPGVRVVGKGAPES